jgi:hypothetical protein
MLLLSPTCWPAYFMMLLLPVAMLWQESPHGSYRRWMLITCVVLLLVPPGLCWACCGINQERINSAVGPLATLTALALQTYAVFGLWSLAATQEILALRAARRPADDGGVEATKRLAA